MSGGLFVLYTQAICPLAVLTSVLSVPIGVQYFYCIEPPAKINCASDAITR